MADNVLSRGCRDEFYKQNSIPVSSKWHEIFTLVTGKEIDIRGIWGWSHSHFQLGNNCVNTVIKIFISSFMFKLKICLVSCGIFITFLFYSL